MPVAGRDVPLAEFLRLCANHAAGTAPEDPDRAICERFLRAGLAAVHAGARAPWLQVGLVPPPGRDRAELYARAADLVGELLATGAATNAFFMHKPPGLRLRLEPAGTATERRVRESVAAWRRAGLVERVVPGVYEPENRLFGGPVSMVYTHRLFTLDAVAWLAFHAVPRPAPTAAAGALSLLMLRSLFAALAIDGWEDVDVWDRIRRRTGRRLEDFGAPPPAVAAGSVHAEAYAPTGTAGSAHAEAYGPTGAAPAEAYGAVAEAYGPAVDGIRECWRHPALLRDQLTPADLAIADAFAAGVAPLGAAWRDGYFATEAAYAGPRHVAAFATIFSWNRARLPMLRQALLTEALATREVTAS